MIDKIKKPIVFNYIPSLLVTWVVISVWAYLLVLTASYIIDRQINRDKYTQSNTLLSEQDISPAKQALMSTYSAIDTAPIETGAYIGSTQRKIKGFDTKLEISIFIDNADGMAYRQINAKGQKLFHKSQYDHNNHFGFFKQEGSVLQTDSYLDHVLDGRVAPNTSVRRLMQLQTFEGDLFPLVFERIDNHSFYILDSCDGFSAKDCKNGVQKIRMNYISFNKL